MNELKSRWFKFNNPHPPQIIQPHEIKILKPIPKELVEKMRKADKMFSALDCQTQIVYALYDQRLFGKQVYYDDDYCQLSTINESIHIISATSLLYDYTTGKSAGTNFSWTHK